MKKLTVLPFLLFALACQDGTPVQPDLDLSPEIGLSQAMASQGNVLKMVPFKGPNEWWETGGGFGCEGVGEYYAAYWAATGNFTHVGHSKLVGTNCWRFLDDPPEGEMPFEFISQSGTLTAANGDLLYWYGAPPKTAVEFLSETTYQMGPFWFTGGTGRFENAQGEFYDIGSMAEDLMTGTSVYSGFISTVGSSK